MLPTAAVGALHKLQAWVDRLAQLASGSRGSARGLQPPAAGCTSFHGEQAFTTRDMFAGYSADTLPALLLLQCSGGGASAGTGDACAADEARLLAACKEHLMMTATADGMARAAAAVQAGSADAIAMAQLATAYLAAPKHSFVQFARAQLQQAASGACGTLGGQEGGGDAMQVDGEHGGNRVAVLTWLVTTHSGMHTQLRCELSSAQVAAEVTEHYLETFTSEASLQQVSAVHAPTADPVLPFQITDKCLLISPPTHSL